MNDLLKFTTCGSVDDGKSTLIGHILYDANLLYSDNVEALINDSRNSLYNNGMIDYSLLLDGLSAEREQGITIDVAYHYFATNNRSFIVADTPGHDEYTRNMAVGASFADLAIILIDITKGIITQTRRHIGICRLMGIKYFVFVVNKMDLVNYSENMFKKIELDVIKIKDEFQLNNIEIIPASALLGDNITIKSCNMPWYKGLPILTYLEKVDIDNYMCEQGFYMPVQYVCHYNCNSRSYQGQIEAGVLSLDDEVTILPSMEKARVKQILVCNKNNISAHMGQAITITLNKEIDVSRGCVIYRDCEIKNTRDVEATLLWMDATTLNENDEYLLKIATKVVVCKIKKIIYKIDIDSGGKINSKSVLKNEVAFCKISLDEIIVADTFDKHKTLGEFILINRISNATSACGIINKISYEINDYKVCCPYNQQRPITLWMTGLSGAGKTTLAYKIKKELFTINRYSVVIDGDAIRKNINKSLKYDKNDRIENSKLIAEIAKLLNDEGLIVICSTMSPFLEQREIAKNIIGKSNFYEIYVSTPLKTCMDRDIKGLYKNNSRIRNIAGYDMEYEPPRDPDFCINTLEESNEEINSIIKKIYNITSYLD